MGGGGKTKKKSAPVSRYCSLVVSVCVRGRVCVLFVYLFLRTNCHSRPTHLLYRQTDLFRVLFYSAFLLRWKHDSITLRCLFKRRALKDLVSAYLKRSHVWTQL